MFKKRRIDEQLPLLVFGRMNEPEIRLWPFRSLDPIPNPLPEDPDELKKCLAPVWVKSD